MNYDTLGGRLRQIFVVAIVTAAFRYAEEHRHAVTGVQQQSTVLGNEFITRVMSTRIAVAAQHDWARTF